MRAVLVFVLCLAAMVPAGAAPEPKKPPVHTLRVASFNCWGVPVVAKLREERLKKLPAALRTLKLDVICLQELWLDSDQKQLAVAMNSTHPHVVRANGGLMTLSRYPIRSQQFVRFPTHPDLSFAERLAGKGLLDVSIESPVGLLRVINTHLTWMRGANEPRTKQLGVALKHIKPYEHEALFLLGDLNLPTLKSIAALHPQYERILQCGLKSANPPRKDKAETFFIEPANTRQHWPRKTTGHTGWDPDHIFFRSGKSLAVVRRSYTLHFDGLTNALSDHNLILGVFSLQSLDRTDATKPLPAR